MSAQETAASAESPQETSPQDTASQETFAFAVSDQLTALNTGALPPAGSAVRNWSSALFGFGALAAVTDFTAFTSPSPSEPGIADGVGRAHRDHEGVVAGRVGNAAGAIREAVVAGRRNDGDAAEPELLDRLVEGVVREAARVRGVQREVRDLDVVLVLVRENPLRRCDHVARPRGARVVHDVERDDVRARRCAGVAWSLARRDPGHERAMAATVAGRVVRQGRQIDLLHDAGTEVGHLRRVDAGVD